MDESGYVYGRRAVLETLRSSANRMNKLFIAEGNHGRTIDEIRELARQNKVVTQTVPRKSLNRYVPGASHQGVVASVSPIQYANIDDLVEACKGKTSSLIVVLDGITNPQNFGAILRTSEAVGVNGVIIPRHRSVSMGPTVSKYASGASEYVPVARVTNIVPILDRLKENGLQIAGTADDADRTIYEVDFTEPSAIVIGSEGGGLRQLVRKKCDFLARIPMYGQVSSLNVSVAAAVVLYEAVRQRRASTSTSP